MIFITASDADYAQLVKQGKNVHDITMSLSKILEGMPTDLSLIHILSHLMSPAPQR